MQRGIYLRENKHKEKNIVKKHYHENYQILYALENEGEITFDHDHFLFSQDNLAYITPYSNHSITSNGKMTVLVLEFHLDRLDSTIQSLVDQAFLKRTKLINLNLFEAGEVRQLFRRMLYEQSQGKAINEIAMRVYLAELLLILSRTEKDPNPLDANIQRAERIRTYINTHYFEIVNASEIAQKLGISVRHVNTIFKEQYHVTPMQYLNEVRMEKAKKLLMETEKDIASICFEVGFEAISTFYRRFKEYTSLSPNKYRVNHKYD